MEHNKRSSFSGKLGYVLSAAGASVGLGNIWRFPYLAAKYGGGIFLLIYILLALTFGYTMIVAETAIGTHDEEEPGRSISALSAKSKWLSFRRLDQRDHSDSDRTVLFRHRRLGHQISGRIYQRKWHRSWQQTDIFPTFISNGVSTEICFTLFSSVYAGDHLCRCAKRNRACIQDL